MMTLEAVEQLAREHAIDRVLLAKRVSALNREIESAKRRRLPGIKAAASKAEDSRSRLHTAINARRELFFKPKTHVFHGIKVGLQKTKGKLQFASAAEVVALIKRHFSKQAELLIKTTENPVKDALLQLSTSDLEKLGCTVTDTLDAVVIKATNSEMETLVDSLLGDANDETENES